MANRSSEVIALAPSLNKQRLAELNQKYEEVFQDTVEFLIDSGYTREQIVDFFELAEDLANYEIIRRH